MSLAAGTRLGPYEVLGLIGAGGMGEVYKARDTRLDRSVAIKILPAELSADPERRARFEREARAIASLAHPHICTLYDIGESTPSSPESRVPGEQTSTEPALSEPRERRVEGRVPVPVHYLVMEHLSGESLAERLRHGPLPLAQALDVAAQIAEALDAAHKHGIVHRDLKPGNVMLTAGGAGRSGETSAKLLDFGLAKLTGHGERPALVGGATAPTMTAPITERGTILGTLQYMAPEQLEGREADARTDLWALGAILYEMVTGRRTFEGESQVSLIGNIMNAEPAALATLQPLTPPALERVVTKCLAKHPDDRWDSAHDVADELRWVAQSSSATSPAITGVQPRRRRGLRSAMTMAGALLLIAVGAGAMWLLRPPAARPSLARVSLDVRPAEELNGGGSAGNWIPTPGGSRTALTWTPDGQALVFVGRRGGVQQLYVRRLDAAEARPLAGTEAAQVPAVSPDGQWVAFWAGGALRKVPLAGGPVVEVAPDIRVSPWGLTWDARGSVYFGRDDGRIWKVSAEGGLSAVTTCGEAEVAHVLPWPLAGEQALLYTVRKRWRSWGDDEVVAQTLTTGTRKVLLRDAADARYVATGHLVFLRRGVLFAVAFDPERLEVRGTPAAVFDGVAQALTGNSTYEVTGAGQLAIAPTGTLAWVRGPVVPYPDRVLVSVDRHGQVSPLAAPVKSYGPTVRLAPGGRQLAVSVWSLSEISLWTHDLARGTLTPLAQGGEAESPVWTPDGQRLVFSWLKDGRLSLARQRADGTTPPELLAPGTLEPSSWTPDGRQLAVTTGDAGGVAVATFENGQARVQPLFQTPDTERWPEFSPDGHWLAYGSNVSGRLEVYVQRYPGPGPRTQVSIEGGASPAWHANGHELFFLSLPDAAGKRRMLVVGFEPGSPARIGAAQSLFEFAGRELYFMCSPTRCFDVAPDGQRFYVLQTRNPPPPPVVTHINLIQNWLEELKAKVPTKR